MTDFVYPPVIGLARGWFKALDMRITVEGDQVVPTAGGAVLACNHVSYVDFIFAGLAARRSKRFVRFMAKQSIFANRIAGPLMRGMKHIPVDRDAGMASYRDALTALKGGEIVGVFPEATISRSFTVKAIKTGAARMAAAAGVPLIPMALWGTQRLWTKGRPRELFSKRHLPISIAVGEPMYPTRKDRQDDVGLELRSRMTALLEKLQRAYPDTPAGPSDAWWQPAYLGGGAPEPDPELVEE
jgi:1-acyl-sn-glycerol-3-phosphate acyltransferase